MRQAHTTSIILSIAITLVFSAMLDADVRTRSLTPNGLVIEYRPKVIGIDRLPSSDVIDLKISNTDVIRSNGEPEIPVRIITVAIPPGSDPDIRVLERQSGVVYNGKLPVHRNEELAENSDHKIQAVQSESIIGAIEKRMLSGLEVIRIPVFPTKQESFPHRVEVADVIILDVTFNAAIKQTSTPSRKLNNLAEKIIINAKQAKSWGRSRTSGFSSGNWPSAKLYKFNIDREGIYRLGFEDIVGNGVPLAGSGVPSAQVKLYGNGGKELSLDPGEEAPLGISECPIFIEDGGDGLFGPGDWLLFYGRDAGGWTHDPSRRWRFDIHHYALSNVYWLSFDPPGGGLRMNGFSSDSLPEHISTVGLTRYYLEDDKFIYHPGGITGSGKEWYGHAFDGLSSFTFTFPAISPDANLSAMLRLKLLRVAPHGATMSVNLNGTELGIFDPSTTSASSGHLFENINEILVNGTNYLTLEQISPNYRALFDWFEISYHTSLNGFRTFEDIEHSGIVRYDLTGLDDPWIFNVTDHNNVGLERTTSITIEQSITRPGRYMALTQSNFLSVTSEFEEYLGPEMWDIADLWSEHNQASVILVTPDGYWNELEPMLDYYAMKTPALRNVKRVQLSEIYNRFSGGVKDISAIRNMLMYAAEFWAVSPEFVVLCGDGDYNYRNIDRPELTNFLPPYEEGVLCTDDWFVDFTPYSMDQNRYPLPEIPIGRLTARSPAEIASMVEKIINYEMSPDYGSWRTRITLVADDEFAENWSTEAEHVRNTELLSKNCIPPELERDKVYLVEYPREFGREKPLAADHLLESINRGTLMVNYMGHGNPTLWAHEHVFVQSRDMPRIESSTMLPLYVAFTCDWAYWDDPSAQSFPEQLLAMRDGGAISAVASTRLTGGGANYNLATNFFCNLLLDEPMSIGEALALAKHQYRRSPVNSATYHVLGDPSQMLAVPKLTGRFVSLQPYPLVPLGFSFVAGEIMDVNGARINNYNGVAEFKILDTSVPHHYEIYVNTDNPYYIPLDYYMSGSKVYQGAFSISDGEFEGNFVVPRDVTMGGELGRVMTYFHNDNIDGLFVMDSVSYAEEIDSTIDKDAPEISIYFDSRAYRPGDKVGSQPLLIVDLHDSSGLNLTGAMGHGVFANIDGGNRIDLTTEFSYSIDNYQSGSLEKRLGPLSAGTHTLEVEAWDSFNNLAVETIDIDVITGAGGLAIQNILNWPNPFKDQTNLTFQLTGSIFPVEYEVRIFTVGGRLIRMFNGTANSSYINDIIWDGLDNAGRTIGNGVYLCRVDVVDSAGKQTDGLGRLVYAK